MKMAKLRRKNASLDRALELARETWHEQRDEIQLLTATRRAEQLHSIQDRRDDLTYLGSLHKKVLRRATSGRAGAERFFCVECNVLYPCRTTEVLAKQGTRLDALYHEIRAA